MRYSLVISLGSLSPSASFVNHVKMERELFAINSDPDSIHHNDEHNKGDSLELVEL